MMVLTGKCRICKSRAAKEISVRLVDGESFKSIIAAYPHLKISESMLSKHRAHIVERLEIEDVSDHNFIDNVRNFANVMLVDAKEGKKLSFSEVHLIDTAVRAVLGRRQLEDAQDSQEAMNELLQKAGRLAEQFVKPGSAH